MAQILKEPITIYSQIKLEKKEMIYRKKIGD